MDATQGPGDTPDKADKPAASHKQGSAGSGTPRIESPSLVPEQGAGAEVPPVTADDRRPPTTALVLAPATVHDQPQEKPAAADAKRSWQLPAMSSLAAGVALALCVGAAAGSLGTLGVQFALNDNGPGNAQSLEQAVARLNSDVAGLKVGIENSSKAANSQLARLSERLDRAQSEPAAKLQKISDAVDRLEKRTQVAALTPPATIPATPSPIAAARMPGAPADVTGSIPNVSPTGKDLSRLPVMPGWVLTSVYGGTALVRTRIGLVELEVGDPLPGGGRVEAIRRDGGRWVVVTSRGLIVAR